MNKKMKPTHKEFGKYLRAVANEFAKYGDAELKEGEVFVKLHESLESLHVDLDHGAERIYGLMGVFISQCNDYGEGWIDPSKGTRND